MTNMFKKAHRVKWHSDYIVGYKTESRFAYAMRGPLTARFIDVCNTIINDIAAKGHIAKVSTLTVDEGVIITESSLDGKIINAHLVWID